MVSFDAFLVVFYAI